MEAPLRRTLDLAGLPLALWDHGGEGPPVLFLHGFLDSGRSFDDLAAQARSFCRPLCLDWRGHGASGRVGPGGAYHQLDHLKDLVGVLDALAAGGEPVAAVVGHSMGGIIALTLAATSRDLLPRLLLLDSLGGYSADAEGQVERLAKVVASLRAPKRPFKVFPDRAAAEARIRENNPGLTEVGAERIARHYFEEQPDGSLVARMDPQLRGPNPYQLPEGHWQALCAHAALPVHVMAPEGGYCHRLQALRERFQSLPDGVWQEVPGVGHHVHVEAPEVVVEALRALLARPAAG